MSKNSIILFLHHLIALEPKASVRIQLLAASLVWLIGSSILLVRGFVYVHDRHWHAWVLGLGLVVGMLKSRAILDKVAKKAVIRIYNRGTAGFSGFLSTKSWLFIFLMMGSGMVLRRTVIHPNIIGAGIMGAIYIGVGSALLIADRIFLSAFYFNILKGKHKS